MPTLHLRNGTKIGLTPAGDKYYRFDDHPGVYIYDDHMTMKWSDENNVSLLNPEYDTQVTQYLAGKLVLTRGLPRQHPMFFEIFHLEVLSPLGVGELPSWATNNTRYIPFGADRDSADGAAVQRRGMGPGDDQRMVADMPALQELVDRYCAGLVAEVTAGPGVGVAFYNSGEIQVRGPVIDGLKIHPAMLDREALPAMPSAPDRSAYRALHGGLRHRETVAALAEHGDTATALIRRDPDARRDHAQALFTMRATLRSDTEKTIRDFVKTVPKQSRPTPETTDGEYFDYLDSSINREAHDAYLAALLGGAKAMAAIKVGVAAGVAWITRYIAAVQGGAEELFPAGWQKMI